MRKRWSRRGEEGMITCMIVSDSKTQEIYVLLDSRSISPQHQIVKFKSQMNSGKDMRIVGARAGR